MMPDHVDLIELVFFAYRDFTGDPDAILDRDGFGRAHHRVLHFVGRRPGLTVAALLAILGITKQSLARVLKDLIESGHVTQSAGKDDRRQRQLFLTAKGRDLAARLAAPQSRRIARALNAISDGDATAVRRFLVAMLDKDNAELFSALHEGTRGDPEEKAP
ncbi:MAG: MarR family transcriptional regulator [Rhizobiaceae bacterium]|nr:MarR family transcriptional regulator [Rhizobiaceae bacterium]